MSDGDRAASPRWPTATKMVVGLLGVVLIGALLIRFRIILPLLILAGLLSYLLIPLVNFLHRRARLGRIAAANVTFVFLALLLATLATAVGLAALEQLQALLLTLQSVVVSLPDRLAGMGNLVLVVGPWQTDLVAFDPATLVQQALGIIQPALTQVSGVLTFAAARLVEGLAHAVFVLAIAYFVVLDSPRLQERWSGLTIPRYESDVRRIQTALGRIWHAFLRGQFLIVLITGLLTMILMSLLGVRYAVALGVLMGLAKLVPIVGPFSVGVVSALVALLQPQHPLQITPIGHAALVIVGLIVLDQAIDYFLLPRIMGASLNLHPAVILIAAIIGASLLGVVGLLLSAPTMATVILLSRYTLRKLFDLSPWDPPIDVIGGSRPALPRLPWRRVP